MHTPTFKSWTRGSLPLALAAALLTPSAQAQAQTPATGCVQMAQAAESGAALKHQGMDRTAVQAELRKRFSEVESDMGATAAFTYVELREFAMADFVESFCRVTVGTGGKLTDFDKQAIRIQYDRSVECAKGGHLQKPAFLACWNEQVRRARQQAASAPQ